MTLLDDRSTPQIPRRSWRDLPAAPPVADLLPPPDPSTFVPPIATATPYDAMADVTDAMPRTVNATTQYTLPVAEPVDPRRRGRKWIAATVVAVLADVFGIVPATLAFGGAARSGHDPDFGA